MSEHVIRYAMFGGAPDSFAGPVHRIAARMDGHFELKAGIFSSDPGRSRAIARELGIEDKRAYTTVEECLKQELQRSDPIQMVSVVTPNQHHYAMARSSLEAGLHVMCEKPLTRTLAEAKELAILSDASQQMFALCYVYSAYPMVHYARKIIGDGVLGKIRMVQVQCPQSSLSEPVEKQSKHAAWRTTPSQSGAGTIADLGTHAFHLMSFVTGLQAKEVCAELSTFVRGRQTDDNAVVMLRFNNNARGIIWVSQVASGYENALRLRVVGSKASLEWRQESPDSVTLYPLNKASETYTRNSLQYRDAGIDASMVRVAKGHPEGFLEAFANLYCFAADAIRVADTGGKAARDKLPDIHDGLAGMYFIDACQRSSSAGTVWVELEQS